ncbi:MAG: 6-phosphofructokinase [Peptostreptococcaceae bacterium]|nr:6-phosphofructokinase [Peptostreptococcaceae bacterium]
MKKLRGACLIGQSGGPTSVINASALGCIETALAEECITKVYGAANGIKGLLEGRIYDLDMEDPAELHLLKHTPSSALGSCRYKLAKAEDNDKDYKKILEIFRKYDIRYFFYNGGNDSMDTCNKISKFLLKNDYECRVMGIPKTIDNDLDLTDHCPGFGSAAKYIATTCMEVYRDATVYGEGSVTVIEIMGRNAGWLTAASALATENGAGPELIYLPEIAFDMEKFITDIKGVLANKKDVMITVSEGIKDKDGVYISSYFEDKEKDKDAFGHIRMGGLASNLAGYAGARVDARVRGIELSLLQRCAAHIASKNDVEESYMAGKEAVNAAVSGITDKMVGFERITGNKYECKTILVDLEKVANLEKKIPLEWINETGNGLLKPFIDYASPLIEGHMEYPSKNALPKHAKLKYVLVK